MKKLGAENVATLLVEGGGDPNSRVSAAISVLTYARASGDFGVGHRVQALIVPIVDQDEVAAAHRFLWRVWLGYILMMIGDYALPEDNYRAADQINQDKQFPWAANLLFIRALCIIGGGDLRDALPSLEGMAIATNRSRPQDLGYLHVARAWKGMMAVQELHLRALSTALAGAQIDTAVGSA